MFRKKYEESWPIISLNLFAFSWHLPVGIAMLALAYRLALEIQRKPWRKR